MFRTSTNYNNFITLKKNKVAFDRPLNKFSRMFFRRLRAAESMTLGVCIAERPEATLHPSLYLNVTFEYRFQGQKLPRGLEARLGTF